LPHLQAQLQATLLLWVVVMEVRLLLLLEVLVVVAVDKALPIQQLGLLEHLDKVMLVEKVLEAMLLTRLKVEVAVVAQELLAWLVFLA
jgi:hypothetical protein